MSFTTVFRGREHQSHWKPSARTLRRIEAILQVADRYDVSVRWVDGSGEIPERFQGSQDGGCNPKKRVVYLDQDLSWGDVGPEVAFHELVHVIVQPPWPRWTIKKVPEEFILMQFERALGAQIFDRQAQQQVIIYQEETYIDGQEHFLTNKDLRVHPADIICLRHIPAYKRAKFWRNGFTRCQTLGILDKANQPTYKMPKWDRLEEDRPRLAKLYGINRKKTNDSE